MSTQKTLKNIFTYQQNKRNDKQYGINISGDCI